MFTDGEKKVFSVLANKSNKDLIELIAKENEVTIEAAYKIFKMGWQSCIAKTLFEAETDHWKNTIQNHQKFLAVLWSFFKAIKDNENADTFLKFQERRKGSRELIDATSFGES